MRVFGRELRVQWIVPVVIFVALIAAWELAVAALEIPRFILPRPSEVIVRLTEIPHLLLSHSIVTLTEIFLGFAIGALLGLGLAVVMVLLPAVRTAVYPIVLATQTTPKIAIAPLLIIWFGVGLTPKVVIVALLAFFPVLVNTVAGLESADRQQLELMRSVNASQMTIYRHIRLPAAIPFIFAGLKLALAVSVIGAIVGEWVSATEGLGYLLVYYNATLNTTDLFAVLVTLVAIASVSFLLIGMLEQLLSWEARVRKATRRGTVASVARPGSAEAGL